MKVFLSILPLRRSMENSHGRIGAQLSRGAELCTILSGLFMQQLFAKRMVLTLDSWTRLRRP